MKKILIALTLIANCAFAQTEDQVLVVPSPETGFFANEAPTNAMLWDTPGTNGVVVLLPGGDGHFKLSPTRPWRKNYQIMMSKSIVDLSDSTKTSGKLSAAFIDSPYPLGLTHYPGARFASAHINRVISVLDTIRTKTNNKPIWLYGHSNGSISVFEVYKELQSQNREQMIAGLIVSGPRDVISLPKKINVPVLFIHHKNDACADTSLADATRNYKKVTELSTAKTHMEILDGPSRTQGHPCFVGTHMFEGLYDELAQTMDKFINQ